MREKAIILERNIQHDLAAIDALYVRLESLSTDNATEETLIVIAYHLNNLYNAFENIFLQIAKTFENTLDDQKGWHTQLLQRMQLDLSPIRPAVIDSDVYDCLDELRRFRHLFRSAYSISFDPRRLQLVLDKALELRSLFPAQIGRFLAFLRTLQ